MFVHPKVGGRKAIHTTEDGQTFSLGRTFDKVYYAPGNKFDIVKNYGPSHIAEVPKDASTFYKRYGNKD